MLEALMQGIKERVYITGFDQTIPFRFPLNIWDKVAVALITVKKRNMFRGSIRNALDGMEDDIVWETVAAGTNSEVTSDNGSYESFSKHNTDEKISKKVRGAVALVPRKRQPWPKYPQSHFPPDLRERGSTADEFDSMWKVVLIW
ncbi:hypothetical protein TNCV_361571 [Trichonephila clavipes]|nr:hypothetical protein TNCV_361571 [Trichonephila clavipes]